MTENLSNKKYKVNQKKKEKRELKEKNIIKFQEPKEEPINQIRNSTTSTGGNDEYNDNLHNLLQVELGDDVIINNQLKENFVDNINHDERIKYLMNVNKNEQIDFINTLLRLKGINSNDIIYDNENDNNLTGIHHLNSNIKPDDESKSYIKEILDICDNNTLNNVKNNNNNLLNNNELNSISLSINNGKDNLIEINPNNNIYNNIYPINKNDKGLKTRDLLEIANRRKKMDKNFDSMTSMDPYMRRRHLEEVTRIERLKKERDIKEFGYKAFTPQISKRAQNIGNKKNVVSLSNLDNINLEQIHFSNININSNKNNVNSNISYNISNINSNSNSNSISSNNNNNNKIFMNVKREKKDLSKNNVQKKNRSAINNNDIEKLINEAKGIDDNVFLNQFLNDNNNKSVFKRENKIYNSYRENISDNKKDINNNKNISDNNINKRRLSSDLKDKKNENGAVTKFINKNNNNINNNNNNNQYLKKNIPNVQKKNKNDLINIIDKNVSNISSNNNSKINKNQRKKNEIEQNINFNYLENKGNRDDNFESKDFEIENNNINSENYIPVESRLFYSTDELEQEQSMLKNSNMNFKTSINDSKNDKIKINLKEIKREIREKEEKEKLLKDNKKLNDSNNYISQTSIKSEKNINDNNLNNNINNDNNLLNSSSSKKGKIKKIEIVNIPNSNINNEIPLMNPYQVPLKLEINNKIYLPNNKIIEAPPTKSEVILTGFPNKQMLISPVINNQIMIPQNQLEKHLTKTSYKTNSTMNNDIVNYASNPSQNITLASKAYTNINNNNINNNNNNNNNNENNNNENNNNNNNINNNNNNNNENKNNENNIINEEKIDLSSIIQFNPDLESNIEFQIQDAPIENSINNNLNQFSSSSFNIVNNNNRSTNNNNNINNNITTSTFSNNFINENNENNENVESINENEESLVSDADYQKKKKQNETTEIKISQIQKDLGSNYNSNNGNNSINLSKLTNFVDYNSNNSKVLLNQNSKKVFTPKNNYYN